MVAIRHSGNVVGHINEVTLRWTRLVLRRVTVFRWANHLSISPSHPGQHSLLPSVGMGNMYQPKCNDALQVGSKGRYGSFYLWINVWVAVYLCDPSLTRAIPKSLKEEFLIIMRYTNLPLFYLLTLLHFTTVLASFVGKILWTIRVKSSILQVVKRSAWLITSHSGSKLHMHMTADGHQSVAK